MFGKDHEDSEDGKEEEPEEAKRERLIQSVMKSARIASGSGKEASPVRRAYKP